MHNIFFWKWTNEAIHSLIILWKFCLFSSFSFSGKGRTKRFIHSFTANPLLYQVFLNYEKCANARRHLSYLLSSATGCTSLRMQRTDSMCGLPESVCATFAATNVGFISVRQNRHESRSLRSQLQRACCTKRIVLSQDSCYSRFQTL